MKTTTRYFASIIILLMAIYGTAFAQTPDTEPPSQPEGLQVIETHNTAIGISWDVSTDNVGVTGYKIFVDDLEHGTSVDNEYIVTGLSINTSYSIQVLSFDAALNEGVRSTDINPTTSTSTITGTVTSSEGPVPGASVTLTGLVVKYNKVLWRCKESTNFIRFPGSGQIGTRFIPYDLATVWIMSGSHYDINVIIFINIKNINIRWRGIYQSEKVHRPTGS